MTLQMKLDEAREEGKEIGIREGKEIGIREGKEVGRSEGRLLALQDLVNAGVITVEKAAEMIGIAKEKFVEQVKNLNEE